jgi:hypothetical protein
VLSYLPTVILSERSDEESTEMKRSREPFILKALTEVEREEPRHHRAAALALVSSFFFLSFA